MASLEEQLFAAAEAGDIRALRACLASGADANHRLEDEDGITPLHAAARAGNAPCINALVAAGAGLEVEDQHGYRALNEAAIWGQSTSIETLLARGASVEARTHFGCTALWLAAEDEDYADCVRALLAAAASTLADGKDGDTPVRVAASRGNIEGLRLMLTALPAAAVLRNKEGNVPLALALADALLKDTEDAEAARCLLKLGAHPPAGEELSGVDWALVPSPCPRLAKALPAVIERSADEAALLVQHLQSADRLRLHTFAMCLHRAQRRRRVPSLPTPLVWRLLALAVA
ncbi:hypothetical protein ABPG75_012959 [Micractinium tetrahymenae]